MKTLHLAVITGIAITSIIVITFLEYSMNANTESIIPLNSTDYETQRIYEDVCKNPTEITQGGNVFVICNHPQNYTDSGPFTLPLPMYKRIECHSPFGCSGKYDYQDQIPQNLLSDDQKQQVIDRALQATGLKKYSGIQFEGMDIRADQDRWRAHVQFVIPHIEYTNGQCGWQAAATVDLNDFSVTPDIGIIGNNTC